MRANEIKILLVDDHPMMREGLRRVLAEQPGLRIVGEAASGQAALEKVRALNPDVAVMDIHMPGAGGIQTSARIVSESSRTKVVILSADNDLSRVRQALQAGVSGYVTKSGPSEEVIRAIREAMDQRVYLSPEIAAVVVQDYQKMVVNQSARAKRVLTEREMTLLKLVAEGKRNKEIAEVLQVGAKSVETYRSRLMRKLGCASTAELTRYAIREGIISA